MACEICPICKEEGTPWRYIEEIGHVCCDCYCNINESSEILVDRFIEILKINKKCLEFIKHNACLNKTQKYLQEEFNNPEFDQISACQASEALRSRAFLKEIGENYNE